MSVRLDAPAREIRREIARLDRAIAAADDPDMARLSNEMRDIYRVVLFRRGLPV